MVQSRQKVEKPKSEVEILREQIALLTKALAKQEVQEAPIKIENYVEDEGDNMVIGSDTYIKVMSLTPYYLTLTTQEFGRGKKFNFEKFGEVKRILYHDLVDIMEQHQNFLNEGYFVILNRDVVRKHGLDDIYSRILPKEKIEAVMSGENQSDAVNLFKACADSQKENMSIILIDKIVRGEFVDLNLLDRLSRIIGYNIAERAEETRKVSEIKK